MISLQTYGPPQDWFFFFFFTEWPLSRKTFWFRQWLDASVAPAVASVFFWANCKGFFEKANLVNILSNAVCCICHAEVLFGALYWDAKSHMELPQQLWGWERAVKAVKTDSRIHTCAPISSMCILFLISDERMLTVFIITSPEIISWSHEVNYIYFIEHFFGWVNGIWCVSPTNIVGIHATNCTWPKSRKVNFS